MAFLAQEFDASTIETLSPFDPLPMGKYLAQAVGSDLTVTKDGLGQSLVVEIEILEGKYKGRKVWERFNLQNRSKQAVEIAERNLAAFCKAVGKIHIKDSVELHLIPFTADIRIKPAKDGYSESNSVRFLPREDGAPGAPAPAAAVAPTANAMPWKRSA